VNQDKIYAGEREGLSTEEQEELRKLRKEVKTLRQEKEILRKATANIVQLYCMVSSERDYYTM